MSARLRRDWCRVAVAALALSAVASCSGSDPGPAPTASMSPQTTAVARDYWPTSGWRTASPKDHGIDPAVLADLDGIVANGYPSVRSVLIVRHGYLVYEHYWHGFDQRSGHDVRSVTKSFIGALVGIALADGKIASPDQRVGDLLPAQLPKDADPRFAAVTIKQLSTMTSGLAGDADSPGGDPSLEDAMWRSPDWVRHVLGRPLETDPGTQFAYSNSGCHLLSAIVANAVGQSTFGYARAKLFNPLGIRTDGAFQPVLSDTIGPAVLARYDRSSVAWPVDPQGYSYGGAHLKLPARDLAKFGYLYLNGGRWDGNQIIPADYVAASTSLDGSSPNLLAGYGWLWWVRLDGGHRTFRAEGYGGQYIYVVPDLDLVTVVTSDPQAGLNPGTLITDTILPAVGS